MTKFLKIFLLISFSLLGFISFSQSFNPSSIPGLQLWLKADSGVIVNSGLVEQWHDASGNGHIAYASASVAKPQFLPSVAELNNKPSIEFDGNDNRMVVDSGFNVGSIFIVFNWDGGLTFNNENCLLSKKIYTPNSRLKARGANTKQIYADFVEVLNTSQSTYINGFQTLDLDPLSDYKIVSVNITPQYFPDLVIGMEETTYYRSWNGEIVEIIIFEQSLSTINRNQIEEYLKNKYSPPVSIPSTIILNSFCDTVVDAGNRFKSYLWSTGDTVSSITINSPGKQWVQVTDFFGFTSSDTVEVIDNKPIFNQLNDSVLCLGDSIIWETNFNNDYYFTWSGGGSDSLFVITQPGGYSVTITDSLGCSFVSLIADIEIDPIHDSISLGPDTSLCEGNEIKLQQGDNIVQSYLWSDNSTASSLSIFSAGQYWVDVTSQNGCVSSDTIDVSIAGIAPDVLFSFNNVCFGDSMYFNDLSVPPSGETIVQWEWDFGDGNLSSSANPVHLFNMPGDYNVKLIATTLAGCNDEYQQMITVYYLPVIGYSTPLVCSGNEIQFTDTSTSINDTITQWSWNFGNAPSGINNFSSSQHPVHQYQFPGVYNVKLIATTAAGCVDSIIKPITVNEKPLADFTFQPVCYGIPVEFINNSSVTLPVFISSYNWDFGINSSTSAEPSFLFGSAGSHNVSLTVSADNGCVSEIQKIVEVYHKPTAWFEPVDVCVNSDVEFKDLSLIADSSINSWNWNFNDVETYSMQNPIVNFNETDVYFVSLKINTINGCKDSVIRIVKIHPLPIPLFTIEPQVVIPGQPMTLNNLSNGSQNYIWNLGDGTISNLAEPEHTYNNEGTFQIKLDVESEFGCKESFSKTLNVIAANMDIAVTNIHVKNYDNYLNITAELTNYGTVAVHEIDMILEQKNGRRIKESWTGDFHSGKKLLYEFNAEIIPLKENIHDYVCVLSLNPNKSTDSNPDNNEYCELLGDNDLILMDPFPNPVTNQLTIRFFLPSAEDIKLEILTHEGKLVSDNFPVKGEKGINTVSFDAFNLQAGMYAIKLNYAGQVYLRRFIKVKF